MNLKMPGFFRVEHFQNRSGVLKARLGIFKIDWGVLKARLGIFKIDWGVLKARLGIFKISWGFRRARFAVFKIDRREKAYRSVTRPTKRTVSVERSTIIKRKG